MLSICKFIFIIDGCIAASVQINIIGIISKMKQLKSQFEVLQTQLQFLPLQVFLLQQKWNLQNQLYKIKQQLTMNFDQSFPVFDLQLDCDFQTSDQKFQGQRKQNLSSTITLEDGNIYALSTIGKRNSNLDKFSYLRKGSCLLMAVFDGHGDDKVSNYLQQNMLRRLVQNQLFETDIQNAIKTVLREIQEQILQIFEKGSTLLIAIVSQTQIIAVNVGDSKLFGLTKTDAKLVPLTRQHDLTNQAEVAQIMSKGGLIFKRGNQYRINGQLNISRSIGDKKHKQYMSAEPEIYRFQKSLYKKIILATDGFYKHQLFQGQLCRRSIKQIENKIRKGVLGYGFQDNATFLCLKIKPSSANSVFE